MALLIVLLVGIGLSIGNSYIQTIITKKLTEQLSERTNTNINIGRVNIGFFNKIVLNNILIEAQNRDTLFYTEKALASIDMLKIRKRRISFSEILFDSNKINIVRDSLNHFNFIFLLDSMKTQKDISIYWNINCNQFGFQQSSLSYQDERSENKKNIFLNDLNLNLSGFYNNKDSVQLNINSLDFNDGKKLFLEQLSATILINKDKIFVKALNMKSKNSYVEDSEVIIPFSNDSTIGTKPEIDFNLQHSEISFLELAEIIPSLRGMNQKIQLSGRIQGNMSYLKGKNIELKTGRRTKAELDFYINDILDIETMYLFFDLRELTSTFSDISRIRLPYKAKINYIKFPESFYESDFLSYTGNFSGFLSDFVSFGTLKSELGILNTDVSVIPKENETVQFRGSISTVDFKLGELLRNSRLGKITFQGEVDGNYYYEESDIAGIFKGNADNFEINDYTYKNIQLDGLYMDEMFDGLLSIDDPNINFDFQGQFDLNERSPEFNFNLKLNRFQPGKLNLSTTFPNSEMAFNMRAKFTGNKIDNLKGLIIVDDGKYQNKNGQFSLNNMQLISVPNDSTNTLTFNSDFVDIGIEGNYDFQSIIHSFRKVANHFLPAIKYDEKKLIRPNSFDYEIDVKDINQLAATFYPGLKFETPFLLYGKIDSEKPDFELAGSIPGIQYNNIWVRNVFIGNKTVDEKYSSIFKFGEVLHRNGMEIYDFTVDSKIAGNTAKNRITWRNSQDSTIQSTIESQTIFSVPDSSNSAKILTDFFPTTIFIADSSWQFSPFTIKLDSSSIYVEDFNIFRGDQNLSVDGNVSKKDSNHLSVNFNNIDLGFLTKSFGTKKLFAGLVNCSIGISGLYTRPAIISNIKIDSFKFEDHFIGDVDLVSHWDQENSVVNSELEIIKNNKKRLKAFGFYNTESGELNYDANADSLSINLLGTVIKNNLSNFEGDATGKVRISGTTDKLALNGALYATDAGLKIDYTQGVYTFNDFVYFKNDTIQFDNITIQDVDKNQGKFNGTLVHDNFKDMIYDMTINSSKIQVLNTTSTDNQQFYGNAIANCKLIITGQGKTVALTGSATTLKGTDINISMDYEGEIQQYDFIEFKRPESDVEREQFFAKNLKSNFSIGLTVEATPEAKVQLIYNSRIGDIIKAQGEGILLFEMDKDFNISLSGDYTLTEGDYLFTLQNVLNKRFTIDQGSSIVWSGDPYNANIDLTAIYKLKASLYDLMVENYLIDDIYQRIPVECKILLTEELTNPLINFEIDFPEEDETVTGILQQYINTEEEMNKQILSLIVMGKFYTPEYLRGTYESQNPNTLGTTASEVFSNQLSNWLSQISNDVDVGFNYRPGNSITNDEIELALSTQIFDDRVTLNGNIGNNVNPESTNSSQIVGDFDMKVKIVPSGKIQFKAFNRSNNNLIYDTAPYTQGIGFTFKEEYNSIDELAKKIGSIFKKKK